ncbi:OmpA family protein [Sphingobium sp. CR28]|uniref:OmpA family protein n=1 Tax=Sphingobium sp. CR28 TaxID=3400272 RepID=UPI003FEDA3BA
MQVRIKQPRHLLVLAMLALPVSGAALAQAEAGPNPDVTVTGANIKGPDIKGFISARSDNKIQVTSADGTRTAVTIDDGTEIRSASGLFNNRKLAADSLLNGLPVTVKTVQAEGTLIASKISFTGRDLKTASMIRTGTAQGFEEQTAATEALRGRMGDIDKYNVKATTNVNFDTGKYQLTEQGKQDLCAAAATANGMENALLLVVGYTDSTGPEEFNQVLSEKRATRVVNYLQQACGWKPYRMLTPTGMAMADPLADNSTPEGKAQNRRVAVNVLVSKAVDGF